MDEFTVLVVDDDIWMQRILSKTLQSYGFTKTFLASNGFDGISLAVEHQPALIIMDILMPELSGLQCLKILKHIRITKDIPVVMVSAMSDSENLGMAVKTGIAGFISKPFTRATIFDKLISIFGKEKLDVYMKLEFENSKPNAEIRTEPPTAYYTSEAKPSASNSPKYTPENSLGSTTPKPVIKNFQEEERRSIDSIKKLLLKTKK